MGELEAGACARLVVGETATEGEVEVGLVGTSQRVAAEAGGEAATIDTALCEGESIGGDGLERTGGDTGGVRASAGVWIGAEDASRDGRRVCVPALEHKSPLMCSSIWGETGARTF